jgi:hypothetical protein
MLQSASAQPQCHIQLTTNGLRNLPHLEKHNDFDIIVGDIHYHCPWHVACFISPRICQAFGTDGSFSEFHISTKDPNNLFKTILSLASGDSLSITPDNRSFYESVFTELGNSEVILSIFEQFEGCFTVKDWFML